MSKPTEWLTNQQLWPGIYSDNKWVRSAFYYQNLVRAWCEIVSIHILKYICVLITIHINFTCAFVSVCVWLFPRLFQSWSSFASTQLMVRIIYTVEIHFICQMRVHRCCVDIAPFNGVHSIGIFRMYRKIIRNRNELIVLPSAHIYM